MPIRNLRPRRDAPNADAHADGENVQRERQRDDEYFDEGRAHEHALRDDPVKLPA